MKVFIPDIDKNGNRNFTNPYVEREANEDYFNTIDDAKEFVFNKYCNENDYDRKFTHKQIIININTGIDDIENCVLNDKIINSLKEDFKTQTNYNILFTNMDEVMKNKYKTELNKLIVIHKLNLNQKNKFIKDNKDEIIEYLTLIKQGYIDNIKNKQKEYMTNWRQKHNELLGIKQRVKLTEEQKLLNFKESKSKYYNKIKSVAKSVANELEQKITEPIKTEGPSVTGVCVVAKKELTEKELKRKECNKRYYENRKLKAILAFA